MSMVEGLGDEVVIFFTVLLALVVFIIAWVSTAVSDLPLVSVVILDRHTFRRLLQRIRTRANAFVLGTQPGSPIAATPSETIAQTPALRANLIIRPSNHDALVGSPPVLADVEDFLRSTPSTDYEQVAHDSDVGDASHENPMDPEPVLENQDHNSQLISEAAASISPQVIADGAEGVSDAEQARRMRLGFYEKSNPQQPTASENVAKESSVASTESKPSKENVVDSLDSSASTAPVPQPSLANLFSSKDSEPLTTTNSDDSAEESAAYPTPSTPSTQPAGFQEVPVLLDGHIRIRLKYLDERQRLVQAKPQETIGEFKRKHFAQELADNAIIRFIHNGQELRQDSMTLQAYNLKDNSTIHCLLSQSPQTPEAAYQDALQNQEFDMGLLMFPMFGLILGMVWYLRIMYRGYFNAMSTFSLVAVTFMFLIALLASRQHPDAREHID